MLRRRHAAAVTFAGVLIREERHGEEAEVAAVHAAAFGDEADVVVPLLDDLRRSLATEPGLSLVALDDDGRVAGHVLFTRNLLDAPQRLVDVQVLSPVAVCPDRQGRGVGSALIRCGLDTMAGRDVPAVFLEGAPAYYSRFGFVAGEDRGFRRPSLRIPAEAFQVFLLPAHEAWMTGTLVYRSEFWSHDSVGLRD